jgi:hypothetical protein
MSSAAAAVPVTGRAAATEWEYQRLVLPRGTSRAVAQRLLSQHAEYGRWELDRLLLLPDGTRRVVLRRMIIRQRAGG